MEDAVYKMTGGTAKRFGVKNRGVIEVGNFADLVVVDLANLSYEEGTNNPPQRHRSGREQRSCRRPQRRSRRSGREDRRTIRINPIKHSRDALTSLVWRLQ
ncbi:MAG: amidohydrolase family protein [Bacillus subtilis]|nr:amidohydrolase family protein [Bacillus subtilis]